VKGKTSGTAHNGKKAPTQSIVQPPTRRTVKTE
jgi:hypothetical protein